MREIVFDIETAGLDWEAFSKNIQEYLAARADDEVKAKDLLGLSPLTGKIIVISMLDRETKTIHTYLEKSTETGLFAQDSIEKEIYGYKVVFERHDEKGILLRFWKKISQCDKFITFNGRGFDVPFIIIRSMKHGIKPTKTLNTNRYYSDVHFDLYDQLTFYNSTKGYSLDMWCEAMGIKSPKDNIKGSDVGEYYKKGKIDEIAEYCSKDVIATYELYKKTKHFFEK